MRNLNGGVQTFTDQTVTPRQADELIRAAEIAFTRADVPAILAMFTPNVVGRYPGLPEVVGHNALEELLHARFARQRQCKVSKTVLAVCGDTIVDAWSGTWIDGITGEAMRGMGMECLRLRGGRVAELDAVFHGWSDEQVQQSQIT